jgi:hypothetical protein
VNDIETNLYMVTFSAIIARESEWNASKQAALAVLSYREFLDNHCKSEPAKS